MNTKLAIAALAALLSACAQHTYPPAVHGTGNVTDATDQAPLAGTGNAAEKPGHISSATPPPRKSPR